MGMIMFLEHQVQKQEKVIPHGSVRLLNHLSEQLSSELAFETHVPCLVHHPYFDRIEKDMRPVMFRLCYFAVKVFPVAMGDMLFSLGEEATRMFFVRNGQGGELEYRNRIGDPLKPALGPGEWLAEAVLWANWRYLGKCCAVNPVELVA